MNMMHNGSTGGVDEGSSSSYAPATTTTNGILEVVIDARMESSRTKLYPKRRMEKVPLTLRKGEKTKGYFDPVMVSIGPYHHGKEELQMAERIKPMVAQKYISLFDGRDMDEFRKNIMDMVDDARSCYLEGTTDKYSDEEFVEIMLLDGLFVLAFIDGYEDEEITCYGDQTWSSLSTDLCKHLGNHAMYFIRSDIISLLENQLPFQVLELLMSLKYSKRPNQLTKMVDRYLDNLESMESKRQDKKRDKSGIDKTQPLHYLEYIWWRQNKLVKSEPRRAFVMGDFSGFKYSLKSISELKAKGIHARSGSVYTERDFKFKSFFFFAVLEIPPLILNPQYLIHISNQIAYEWTPNNGNNLPTMAYINFMKSLINTVEDVKELRAKNILFSPCASDEEVVKMFNNISTFGVEYFSIYDDVKLGIYKHYNNRAKTWFSELINKYFSSPWTFIAFIAATALIILSFLQTYYTIFPRK